MASINPNSGGLNKSQKQLLLILAGELVICLIIWRRVHYDHVTLGILVAWFLTEFLAALTLRLMDLLRGLLVVFGITAAALAADLFDVGIDMMFNPYSHPLFPRELLLTALLAFCAAVIGVGFGSTFKPNIDTREID